MTNKEVLDLEYKISDIINQSNVQPIVVGLVLNKIAKEVENITAQVINKEIADEQKAQEQIQEKAQEQE